MQIISRIVLVFLLLAPATALAFPIAIAGTEGEPVIVNGTDDVIATYRGNSASYSNDLYFGIQVATANQFVFNNHSSPVGGQVNLGSFPVGTELIFRLYVRNTGYNFYSGAADRNPDNHFHARVQNEWQPGETLVSFEDLYNGAFHYNDLSFSFTNTSTSALVCNAGGPYQGHAGMPMHFDASQSFDTDGDIVSFEWDFGDGNTGTGIAPTHTYAADGNYVITLCITDNDGNTECCSPESPAVPSKTTSWGAVKSLYR